MRLAALNKRYGQRYISAVYTPLSPKRRAWPSLLLAALLATAQVAAAVHAFAHDPGAPQTKTCGTCVTVAQLGAATVDTTPDFALPHRHAVFPLQRHHDIAVACFPAHRQRGPPLPA